MSAALRVLPKIPPITVRVMAAKKEIGNSAFQKVWKRNAFHDSWGVESVYAIGAWRIWQAAIRHERKAAREQARIRRNVDIVTS